MVFRVSAEKFTNAFPSMCENYRLSNNKLVILIRGVFDANHISIEKCIVPNCQKSSTNLNYRLNRIIVE